MNSDNSFHIQKYNNSVTAATAALEKMAHFGIAPTPQNYTLWFEYCRDSQPLLNHRLNQLIQDQQTFTEELCNTLYMEFFAQDHFSVSLSSSDAIAKIASQVQSEAEQMGDNISDYGNLLKLSLEDLQSNASLSTVKEMAARLIQQSEKAHQDSSASAEALKSMSKEIERLTGELREASQIANTDPLTGIANRRFFDSTFEELFQNATQGTPLTCILIDIDHFKNINDTYGHPVGDLVIRFIANLLLRAVDDVGVVARYGGEEFAILVSGKELVVAEALAESVRKAICRQELKSKEHNLQLGQITASFGVSSYQENDSIQSLLNRTDSNLYHAKQTGRNRVVAL